jgi:hypothetical protein
MKVFHVRAVESGMRNFAVLLQRARWSLQKAAGGTYREPGSKFARMPIIPQIITARMG